MQSQRFLSGVRILNCQELESELDFFKKMEFELDHLPSDSATLGCRVEDFWMESDLQTLGSWSQIFFKGGVEVGSFAI